MDLLMVLHWRRDGRTVALMEPGAGGYLPPSALILLRDGGWHVRMDALVRHAPDAQASLFVRRTAAGYIADVSLCSYRWAAREQPAGTALVPVVQMICGDEILR